VIVAPDTVLRWQRRRFRLHWSKLSGQPTGGRPPISPEIRALVTRMAAANPLWGAPRIHGELLKLGIDVAERTVSRLIPNRTHRALARVLRPHRARPPSPPWWTPFRKTPRRPISSATATASTVTSFSTD
jgi:hypothetical protein